MATRTRRPRVCTYCTNPGANACVRVHTAAQGGAHIYAHRPCAEARKVPTLYVFLDEVRVGEPA